MTPHACRCIPSDDTPPSHTPWTDLFMIVHLREKEATEYNGWEQYVAEKMNARDTSFFPLNHAIVLKEHKEREERGSLEVHPPASIPQPVGPLLACATHLEVGVSHLSSAAPPRRARHRPSDDHPRPPPRATREAVLRAYRRTEQFAAHARAGPPPCLLERGRVQPRGHHCLLHDAGTSQSAQPTVGRRGRRDTSGIVPLVLERAPLTSIHTHGAVLRP